MNRVLITGAAGFVGFHLAMHESQEIENQVFVVDNFTRGNSDLLFEELISRPNVTLLNGNLLDREFVGSLPDVDYIFHLAALNGTENFYTRPFDVLTVSTISMSNLVERYANTGIRRMLFSSTSETYASTVDEFGWEVPTSEDVPLSISDISNLRWSYAAGKIAAEASLFAARSQFNFPFTIVRYHNVYGPRMGNKHVIPEFINRCKAGVFHLYGAVNRRSFIYVDDAVLATSKLIRSEGSLGEIVHVGTDNEVSILELANLILKIGNWLGEIEIDLAPEGSVARRQPNITKMKKLISFEPKVDLKTGLQETVDYYLKNDK